MANLLIVDDDEDARNTLCRFLESEGHSVKCFAHGKTALHSMLEEAPDLIILDLIMPEMDGIEFLEIVRAYLKLQSLPVIVLTGMAESPMIERIRSLKVNAIVVKGKASPQEILEVIQQELHKVPN